MEQVAEQILKDSILLSVNSTNRHCLMCGADFDFDSFWDRGHNWRPDNNLCINCQFWYDKTLMLDEPNVARINNEHYIIGESNSIVKGMDGRKVKIQFNDGRIIQTDDLWHQGRIPIAWRKYLFNNAKFI